MNNKCDFCGTTFFSINNLITHKRTAKYCLALRNVDSLPYYCELCEKTFTTESYLKKHQQVCEYMISDYVQELLHQKELINIELKDTIQYLEEDIIAKELEISDLKLDIARLNVYEKEYYVARDKPTTTNNTTNNKLKLVNTSTIAPFTTDLVKERLENEEYTYDMFMLGSAGIKRFITSMITKNDEKNYVTTDTSRSNFHRFRETKKWSLDAGAKFLAEVFGEMKPIVMDYWTRFNIEAGNAKSIEEHEDFDLMRDRIKPVVLAIDGSTESKHRKELLGDIIKHIKPYVAI